MTSPDPAGPSYVVGRALSTDHFGNQDEFTRDELALLLKTRAFIDDEVLPVIGGFWERAEFPRDLAKRMGGLGLVGDGIEGHGCPPMSPMASELVNMELNRGDGSLGTFPGVQSGLAMKSIDMLGSTEQKQRWLPGLASVASSSATTRSGKRRRRSGSTLYASQLLDDGQPGRAARPVPTQGLDASTPDDRPQHHSHDDGIVGVADHRHEVGDKIDRRGQVDQQECQANAYPSGDRPVGGQPTDQPDQVGHQSQRVFESDSIRMTTSPRPQRHKQHGIDDEHANDDADQCLPHLASLPVVGAPCSSALHMTRSALNVLRPEP